MVKYMIKFKGDPESQWVEESALKCDGLIAKFEKRQHKDVKCYRTKWSDGISDHPNTNPNTVSNPTLMLTIA